MQSVANLDYEADLTVKVIKADGTTYEVDATEIEVCEELDALIKEYKAVVSKALELEKQITNFLKG